MASNTKSDYKKALEARNVKTKIDLLAFEVKQRDQKISKLKQEINNLTIENEKLKKELASH